MSPSRRSGRVGRLTLALALVCPAVASAQLLPQETVSLAGGRLTLGGEVTATVAPDDEGQFNYTDYERSALQLLRLGVTASFRPVERIALVTELRAEGDTNGGPWTALPFAAYVRVRPWKDRPFDIQAGRIPPVFGAAGRRIYANDNVLIGYPLAWQYLTVLRSDAVPSSADELIARAGGRLAAVVLGWHARLRARRAAHHRVSIRHGRAGARGRRAATRLGCGRRHRGHAVESRRARPPTAARRCPRGWRSGRRRPDPRRVVCRRALLRRQPGGAAAAGELGLQLRLLDRRPRAATTSRRGAPTGFRSVTFSRAPSW